MSAEELNNANEGQSRLTVGLGAVLYSYKGTAYNRPCSRGICVGKDMDALEDKLPEGDFYIEITVRGLAL